MRLIDANEFIEYLGLDEENAREENLGEIVKIGRASCRERVSA